MYLNRVGGKRKFSSYFRFPTSHTTVRAVRHTAVPHCSVQFDIVVHKARVTCSAQHHVCCRVVHYALRICPITLAAISVDSCPIRLDTAFDKILDARSRSLSTLPYTHSYPPAQPFVHPFKIALGVCKFEVFYPSADGLS